MRTTEEARALGYRSGTEARIAEELERAYVKFDYEPKGAVVKYEVPAKPVRYLPDFVLENGIIIEVKGLFTPKDRKKHLLIKDQYPELDIRFVFSNPKQRLSKASKTTYAKWCEKNGFQYANGSIPARWIAEPRKLDVVAYLGAV